MHFKASKRSLSIPKRAQTAVTTDQCTGTSSAACANFQQNGLWLWRGKCFYTTIYLSALVLSREINEKLQNERNRWKEVRLTRVFLKGPSFSREKSQYRRSKFNSLSGFFWGEEKDRAAAQWYVSACWLFNGLFTRETLQQIFFWSTNLI